MVYEDPMRSKPRKKILSFVKMDGNVVVSSTARGWHATMDIIKLLGGRPAIFWTWAAVPIRKKFERFKDHSKK